MKEFLFVVALLYSCTFIGQSTFPSEMINVKQKKLYRYHSKVFANNIKYQSYKIYEKISQDSVYVNVIRRDSRSIEKIIDSLKKNGYTDRFTPSHVKDAIVKITFLDYSYCCLDTVWNGGKIKSIDSLFKVPISISVNSSSKGVNKIYYETRHTNLKREKLQSVLEKYYSYKLVIYNKADIYFLECLYGDFFRSAPSHWSCFEVFQRGFWKYF